MNNSVQKKVIVAGGNPGHWHANDRAYEAHLVNGVEAWVFALNAEYVCEKNLTPSMIAKTDLLILNLNAIKEPRRLINVFELLINRPSHVQVMTLLEGDMLWYLKPLPFLQKIFDASTFVNCINIHAESFIQSMTHTPVHTLGIPYPVHGVRKLSKARSTRSNTIHICPFLRMRRSEYQVAKQLNLPIRGFERRLSVKPSTLISNKIHHGSMFQRDINKQYVSSILNDSSIDIIYEEGFHRYFSIVADSSLWLNFDERYTWGRYVLDAAALDVPIISTVNTGHAKKLFPDITIDSPFAIDQALDMAKRVLGDQAFSKQVSEYAWEQLQEYTPEQLTNRLWEILE